MSLQHIFEKIEGITQRALEKPREPSFGEIRINEEVARVLENRGITKFYSHQAKGIKKLRSGSNVVIDAPTASGKSEIYLVPVIEAALEGKRSLLVFPTKALARDQHMRLKEFAMLGVRSSVYDGDVPQHERSKIRAELPHILVTNMDMLHHMLLNARLFAPLWSSLKFVVVDEIHSYTGTLGGHAAFVLRRLKRVVKKFSDAKQMKNEIQTRLSGGTKEWEKNLQFIALSATVGNAHEFAQKLFGEKFTEVSGEGAPSSGLEHWIVLPEKSYTVTSVELAKELLEADVRKVLVFGNSHSVVERMGVIAAEEGFGLKAYRAGLGHEQRKKLESEFRAGGLRAMAATSALELGMDIGSVDAVVLAGFPGSVTRVRQRLGRAGRKGQQALAVYVARDNPLDVYYAEHKNEYLKGRPEDCHLSIDNKHIIRPHLLASCRDAPLNPEEIYEWGPAAAECFSELLNEGVIRKWGNDFIPEKKALGELRRLSIRGTAEPIRILDAENNRFIGEREEAMALRELFPGALYLHGGVKYRSLQLNLDERVAVVRRDSFSAPEYTSALVEKDMRVVSETIERDCCGGSLSFGSVHVKETVYGYAVKDFLRNTTVYTRELDESISYEFDTRALWMDFPESMTMTLLDFGDGLHAVEHVSIAMMPSLTGADPGEIGGLSYPSGRMYVYDGVAGGSGVTEVAFPNFESFLSMARDRIEKCKCNDGCPKCILDPMCGNNNQHLSKNAAKQILSELGLPTKEGSHTHA